jgi:RimJ/RimL family protein N-acetyltransferase
MHAPVAALAELPVLTTERLTLRPLSAADAPALFEVFSDPDAMRYWSSPPHPDLARTEAMIEAIAEGFEDRSNLQWGIERDADGSLLGTVTLMPAGDQPRAELGYILASAHWGRGYGGEAQRRAIAFAFEDLGLHRLEADTHPANESSLRSLERLGFRREGVLRERWLVGAERSDSAILGLLAREWRSREAGRPHL